jgi:hypothetical protein
MPRYKRFLSRDIDTLVVIHMTHACVLYDTGQPSCLDSARLASGPAQNSSHAASSSVAYRLLRCLSSDQCRSQCMRCPAACSMRKVRLFALWMSFDCALGFMLLPLPLVAFERSSLIAHASKPLTPTLIAHASKGTKTLLFSCSKPAIDSFTTLLPPHTRC